MEQQIGLCTSADGTRIAYATYGDGPGTPLVFGPFWGVSQELLWKLPEGRTLLDELARGRKLVTFDRRGMGGSEREVDDVHVGLNAGEPVAEGGDLFGTAVQLARRICDQAEPGRILVSNVVRELVAGKGFLFADRGETALRGFEDPVRLFEVRWAE